MNLFCRNHKDVSIHVSNKYILFFHLNNFAKDFYPLIHTFIFFFPPTFIIIFCILTTFQPILYLYTHIINVLVVYGHSQGLPCHYLLTHGLLLCLHWIPHSHSLSHGKANSQFSTQNCLHSYIYMLCFPPCNVLV